MRNNKILLSLIEDELELSIRSQNCLNNANIRLIGHLVQTTKTELLKLRSFGKNSLSEIKDALAEIGLSLSMSLDFPPWQNDVDGAVIVEILSNQDIKGGFIIDADLMNLIGIELEGAINKSQYSECVLNRLIELGENRPYLADVIKRQKKCLQKLT